MNNKFKLDVDVDQEEIRELITIFDNFFVAMSLCGHSSILCDITKGKSSHFGNQIIHEFLVWSKLFNNRVRFKFIVFDNKSITKAKFYINVPIDGFNARKFSHKLKKTGFTTWNLTKGDTHYRYELYCYESTLQLRHALRVFSDYIM